MRALRNKIDNAVSTLVALIYERRRYALAIILLTTVAMALLASRIEINATPYFLDASHPSRVAERFVKSTFLTTGESLFITVVAKEDSVFNPRTLETIHDLTGRLHAITLSHEGDTQRLQALAVDNTSQALVAEILAGGIRPSDLFALRGLRDQLTRSGGFSRKDARYLDDLIVRVRPVVKVRSMVTVESVTAKGDTLDIHPMMYRVPVTAEGIAALKEEALGNRLLRRGLFSDDGKATNIQIELAIPQDDSPNMEAMYKAVAGMVDTIQSKDSFHLGGSPVVTTQTAAAMEKDSARLFPGVILVMLAVLFFTVRNPLGVALPLVVSIISVIWTLGTMAALGVKQNIVSTMLPVFLISIGVADAIHFLAEYQARRRRQEAPKVALVQTVRLLWWPMLMTSATTAVGFLSLAYTDIRFIREFGLFVALGTVYALIVTCALLPAALAFGKREPSIKEVKVSMAASAIAAMARRFGSAIEKNHSTAIVAMIAIFALSAYSLKDLRVDNKAIGYFEEDSRIRRDNDVINRYFGGTLLMNITFRADQPNAFKDPALIAALEKVQQRLLSNADIGYVYGMPDFMRLINKALHGDDPAQYRLPLQKEEIAQDLLLYESSSGRGLFDVVDPKFQNARIVAFTHSDRSSVLERSLNDALQYARTIMPAGIAVEASGFGEILVSTKNEVVYGQIASLLISMIAVTLLLAWQFRSILVGVLGALPTALTILMNFALMPRFGMVLDIGTVIVSGIAMGVGVDYAIHFLSRIREEVKAGMEPSASIRAALEGVAVPIIFNSMAVGLGFAVLAASSFAALVNLGWLVSSTMLVSGVMTLMFLPPILSMLRPKALFGVSTAPNDSGERHGVIETGAARR